MGLGAGNVMGIKAPVEINGGIDFFPPRIPFTPGAPSAGSSFFDLSAIFLNLIEKPEQNKC